MKNLLMLLMVFFGITLKNNAYSQDAHFAILDLESEIECLESEYSRPVIIPMVIYQGECKNASISSVSLDSANGGQLASWLYTTTTVGPLDTVTLYPQWAYDSTLTPIFTDTIGTIFINTDSTNTSVFNSQFVIPMAVAGTYTVRVKGVSSQGSVFYSSTDTVIVDSIWVKPDLWLISVIDTVGGASVILNYDTGNTSAWLSNGVSPDDSSMTSFYTQSDSILLNGTGTYIHSFSGYGGGLPSYVSFQFRLRNAVGDTAVVGYFHALGAQQPASASTALLLGLTHDSVSFSTSVATFGLATTLTVRIGLQGGPAFYSNSIAVAGSSGPNPTIVQSYKNQLTPNTWYDIWFDVVNSMGGMTTNRFSFTTANAPVFFGMTANLTYGLSLTCQEFTGTVTVIQDSAQVFAQLFTDSMLSTSSGSPIIIYAQNGSAYFQPGIHNFTFQICGLTAGVQYWVPLWGNDGNNFVSIGDEVYTFNFTPVTTGLEESSTIKMKTYPNPVVDALTIEFENDTEREIVIIDGLGRIVVREVFHKNLFIFKSTDLLPGIYYLRVSEKGSTRIEKIVLQ